MNSKMPGFTAEVVLEFKVEADRRRDYNGHIVETANQGVIIPAGCLGDIYRVCRAYGGGRIRCGVVAVVACV